MKQRVMKVCALLPCVGGRDWQWGAPCGKMCPCRSGKARYEESYRKREKDDVVFSQTRECGMGPDPRALAPVDNHGEHFLYEKILRTEGSPGQTRVWVSFVATNHHFCLPEVSTSISHSFIISLTLQQEGAS